MRRWLTTVVAAAAWLTPAAAHAAPPSFPDHWIEGVESQPELRVPVERSEALEEPLRVGWRIGPPTRIADAAGLLEGRDYAGAAGTVEFAPGERRSEIVVDLLDDAIHDGGGMMAVSLDSQPGPYGDEAVFSIADDEAPPPVSVGDARVPESAGSVTLPVLRPWPSTSFSRYRWRARAGTARPDADFEPATGLVGVNSMALRAEFAVPVRSDERPEGDETFEVTLVPEPLVGWGSGISLVGDGVATVTIADDDEPLPPRLTAAPRRGRVLIRKPGRSGARRLRDETTVGRGTVLDAGRGVVRLRLRDRAGRERVARVAGGAVRVRALARYALAGGTRARCATGVRRLRHVTLRADPGLWFSARAARTAALEAGAAWRLADRCDGTRVAVRAGRVRAVAAGAPPQGIPAGQRRLFSP